MTLPASGQISLNEIHIEAGGTTGTACTINDTDIRGLIGISSAVPMDFADWYGASSDWVGPDWDTTQYNVWNVSTLAIEGQQYSGLQLNDDGTFSLYGSKMSTLNYDWHTSPSALLSGDFEYKYDIITVYAAGNGLSTSGISENVWTRLNTIYYIEARDPTLSTGNTEDYLVRVHIRPYPGGSPEYTQDFNLYAKWEP